MEELLEVDECYGILDRYSVCLKDEQGGLWSIHMTSQQLDRGFPGWRSIVKVCDEVPPTYRKISLN